MQLPLGFYDLSLWLTFSVIILYITSEFFNPLYGQKGILIDKDRLRIVALILGILFLLTNALRIVQIIIITL
ncbi:MAG: hypothetical protein ACFFDN_06570 [Candidatus Hodarchaeota archaeon]